MIIGLAAEVSDVKMVAAEKLDIRFVLKIIETKGVVIEVIVFNEFDKDIEIV